MHPPLTVTSLATAIDELAARDPDLAGIVARFGPPPLWDRQPGFATLLHIVLEQQVSLASAAAAIESGALDLDALAASDDETVHRSLQAIPGIGPWTSTIYLLMVLGRPDVWPAGDIALAAAVGEVKGLEARPSPAEMAELGEAWRPWRSVAARLFWHDYLGRRGRSG